MENLSRPRSLVRAVESLRSGERDLTDEVADVCDRIDGVDPTIEAFVPESDRRSRLTEAAAAAAQRWGEPEDRPALYGAAVGVKDVVHVDGLTTRAGTDVPAEELRGEQAGVVDRLIAAGALVAGKTRTAEFAVSAPGPTRNPHRTGHTPGGSSSGSAAAVAAGLVPLAIGTQTVSSTVRPASYCGVVGFKPSTGRLPIDGVIPNTPTLDTIGLFTADVESMRLAAGALCDEWSGAADDQRLPVLGVPTGPFLDSAEKPALEAFDRHVARLRKAGLEVREVVAMEKFNLIRQLLFVIQSYEIHRVHADWFSRHSQSYREQTASAVQRGRRITQDSYELALQGRQAFQEGVQERMSAMGVDMWICPGASGTAPEGLDNPGSPVMCVPWSLAGLPDLTIPAGLADDGLPLGVQCVGRMGDDEQVLAWAAKIESALAD
ncbi:MAG: amidase [Stackebrandtia sp.]